MSKWSDPSPVLIRRERRLSCLTQKEVAKAIKGSPDQISNWENGKHRPTSKSLEKLAAVYECDITDFYLVDVATVRTEATAVVMGYFRDASANIDRKASVAAHLLCQLPDVFAYGEPDEITPAEQNDTELLDVGDPPNISTD